MDTSNSINWSVVVAFALPLLLIGGLALSVYWPQWQVNPQYDFVYTSCSSATEIKFRDEDRNCEEYLQDKFIVNDDGQLIDTATSTSEQRQFRFFRHDVTANQSTEIPYSQVETLTLSPLLTAPDGVTIGSGYENHGSFFLFGGGGEYEHYLTQDGTRVRLNLIQDFSRYSYRDAFYFVGWILSE